MRMSATGARSMREYAIWGAIIERCENPNATHYDRYGGRGIKMCARWRESFWAFLEDMGRRPTEKHQIDRIDNDGNYEPGNCRWATKSEQMRNKSDNRLLTLNGETLPLIAWMERTGLSRSTIFCRIRNGWSVERALTTPQVRHHANVKRGLR